MSDSQAKALGFGAIAADYAYLRSGPPAAAVNWLVPQGCRLLVELGAGTGLATRELAKVVRHVAAVEPDARMRTAFSVAKPNISLYAGTAEDIPARSGTVGGVCVFDAWHWFDPEPATAEIARVLKPGGTLSVAWNLADRSVDWMAEFWAIVINAHPESRSPGRFVLPGAAPFGIPECKVVPWRRSMAPVDLVRLLGTYSPVLAMEPEERAEFLTRQREYLDRQVVSHDGELIDVPFVTVCWRTQRVAR